MSTQEKIKVLFVCVHNSARSQMAEAFLNHLAGDKFMNTKLRFQAASAGLEKGVLNQLAVEAMREVGIDISANQTKSVFDIFKQGAAFNYVITVCDEASAERCPVFPGVAKRLHWGFADPSALTGSQEEKLEAVRRIRDEIRQAVLTFVSKTGKGLE
jgi:arsenate reductase